MDYQDFEKLYRTTPIIFHLGMELFEDRGRNALSVSTDRALCAAVTAKLSNLLSADNVLAVVKAARDLAGLKSVELLAYAAHCGIRLEDGPIDEPEICPICGNSLHYGANEVTDELRIKEWVCESCGATGKEGYRMVFDCHYYVKDREGKLVGRPNQNK